MFWVLLLFGSSSYDWLASSSTRNTGVTSNNYKSRCTSWEAIKYSSIRIFFNQSNVFALIDPMGDSNFGNEVLKTYEIYVEFHNLASKSNSNMR